MRKNKETPKDNPHIDHVAVLNRPGHDEALAMLRHVARAVSLLMRQRRLHIGTLREFYPGDRRLLGLNVGHGIEVRLRLRHAGDEMRFLSAEAVLETLLHELTHNWFGPHDRKFYKRLDELMAEQWYNEQQGLYDTFLGSGQRLGGAIAHGNVLQGTAQASRRRGRGRGRKLGGRTRDVGDPREMAAKAAQRRLADQVTCGARIETAADARADPGLIVIDLCGEEETAATTEAKPRPKEIIDLTLDD
ncbi:hypothetical protein TBLA_0B01010 [Henningerozyma blattae CBS 6284]|uniref:WLM domain-containing protein n=1 Tax=Henningerozyma blattae (strain ATCC 34711 / CBS 6284 / DSM 70876 / NBRC 10599 / NRRL Y-10934 / UCD 77-7) TaxID=1071380 RepID=I2GXU2_HENB6|nr:hypothetical protein TBLA_0B01010 [Tetrapisispora blattae CBS 6284]CCH58944.1 hypothetical protein TBLA_0B01010 [Tetrapisispora blattae CBS 6284]